MARVPTVSEYLKTLCPLTMRVWRKMKEGDCIDTVFRQKWSYVKTDKAVVFLNSMTYTKRGDDVAEWSSGKHKLTASLGNVIYATEPKPCRCDWNCFRYKHIVMPVDQWPDDAQVYYSSWGETFYVGTIPDMRLRSDATSSQQYLREMKRVNKIIDFQKVITEDVFDGLPSGTEGNSRDLVQRYHTLRSRCSLLLDGEPCRQDGDGALIMERDGRRVIAWPADDMRDVFIRID